MYCFVINWIKKVKTEKKLIKKSTNKLNDDLSSYNIYCFGLKLKFCSNTFNTCGIQHNMRDFKYINLGYIFIDKEYSGTNMLINLIGFRIFRLTNCHYTGVKDILLRFVWMTFMYLYCFIINWLTEQNRTDQNRTEQMFI